jgi:hypothetical protein
MSEVKQVSFGLDATDAEKHGFTADGARPRERVERLFLIICHHNRFLCELHDEGPHGVTVQMLFNDRPLYSWRFDTQALAVQWAEAERKAIEKDSAVVSMEEQRAGWPAWSVPSSRPNRQRSGRARPAR